MKQREYSREVTTKVNEAIPKDILESFSRNGWNAFGIYELVKEKLVEEKKGKQ